MAYIRKIKNREGKIYIYLVESYREGNKVKSRTLKNFGLLEELEKKDSNAYDHLRQEAKNGKLAKEFQKDFQLKFELNEEIKQSSKSYGWKFLDSLFQELGLEKLIRNFSSTKRFNYNLIKILKLLVYQRILNPQSKLATVESQKDLFGDWDLDEISVYRALDFLNLLKSSIQEVLHKKISSTIGRSAILVFYDVTNYYFETDLDDEDTVDANGEVVEGFRRRGPSKKKRPNPIVQMGLFIDSNGIPISYQLFRGNQTDPVTYLPAIEQVKKQFGLEKVVVVADKALNSMGNVSKTLANGDGWLFSQKFRGKRGAPKDIQAFALDSENWEVNDAGTFAKKSMLRRRELKNGASVQEKVLVTWNKRYADRERIRRELALDYAKKLTKPDLFRETCRKGGKRYLMLFQVDPRTGERRKFKPEIEIDEETVSFDAQFDGLNVLVTSEFEMSDDDMVKYYKELYLIEDCFRVTKTQLSARPVFVWTREHIEAHFLVCFVSLVMVRIIQNKISWEMSVERIVNALKSAVCEELGKGFWKVEANKDLVVLNQKLGIDWGKHFVTFKRLNNYSRGWFTT
jgi:hypothetical protein